jgi:glycosyltransferase involved in cell wall biosynthesis
MKASAGRIVMLVEQYYPQDSRVRNEALTLTQAGYDVTVIALRKPGQSWTQIMNGVQVYRIPRLELFRKTAVRSRGLAGRVKAILGYMCEYTYFTIACFFATLFVALRHGFDVIHTHNPPDLLFAVALPFKLFGKRFVFDHHDLSPELYASRFGRNEGFIPGVLTFVERCSLRLADMVIATNESYRQIEIERGSRNPATVFVVRNGPNSAKMTMHAPSERLRAMNRTIICYVGYLNPQDGADYLLRSLQHLLVDLKRTDFYCVLMGSGDSLEDLRELRTNLALEDHLEITGYIAEDELLANLAAADICVDPDPSNPLNDQSTWIKIMEYMAYEKPIVSFDLKETRFSAQEAALFVKPNDERAFAAAIARLMDDPDLREKMGKFGRARVLQELQWSVVSKNLITAYESLRLSACGEYCYSE